MPKLNLFVYFKVGDIYDCHFLPILIMLNNILLTSVKKDKFEWNSSVHFISTNWLGLSCVINEVDIITKLWKKKQKQNKTITNKQATTKCMLEMTALREGSCMHTPCKYKRNKSVPKWHPCGIPHFIINLQNCMDCNL